jgi:hypothetical protein
METSRATKGGQVDSEENSNMQPKKEAKPRTLTVKMERLAYTSIGRNRPHVA